jgi:hypothetical protein
MGGVEVIGRSGVVLNGGNPKGGGDCPPGGDPHGGGGAYPLGGDPHGGGDTCPPPRWRSPRWWWCPVALTRLWREEGLQADLDTTVGADAISLDPNKARILPEAVAATREVHQLWEILPTASRVHGYSKKPVTQQRSS